VDASSRPAYLYTLDQDQDKRSEYRVSDGVSRDHWHLLGNDRMVATAHNGGYVQVYDWSRGCKLLNKWNPNTRDYAGGFVFVHANDGILCTLRGSLPEDAVQTRLFGMGYAEKSTQWAGLEIHERTEAPAGDDPVLLRTVRVTNHRDTPQRVSLTEYWGYTLECLLPMPMAMPPWRHFFQWRRARWNRRFRSRGHWDAARRVLSVESVFQGQPRVATPEDRCLRDHFPKRVFLAALDAVESDFPGYCSDKQAFFDTTGLAHPPGVLGSADGRMACDADGAVLAFRHEATLEAGEKRELRFMLGVAEEKDISSLLAAHTDAVPDAPRLCPTVEFVAPDAPELRREMMWHSYYLQAGSIFSDYFQAHVLDQGSAYSYIHGFCGATRDFALFALPLVYLRPDLAKDTLRFCARMQNHRTGRLPYAFVGHGCVRGYVVHSRSSDLDLFFLWAAAEYLAATQDRDFLDEDLPFYPLSANRTGSFLEHCRRAFRHLTERVGVGPHGVLRTGTGDWNDVLIGFSRFSPLTLWRGESALNAALAALVLPRMADVVEHADPAWAEEMRAFGRRQVDALEPLWAGSWLIRGYLGWGDTTLGHERVLLDTQPFPVLAGLWNEERSRALFATVRDRCTDPQRVGATCLSPPLRGPLLEPGADTNGGTWAAIDGWLAAAWSLHDPVAAWDFFRSTTLAAHAEAYPEMWYGVWSGPDSYNARDHSRPGETFQLNATPMTDFPVMNMNRHASPLFAAIQMAGFAPRGNTIVIDPHLPFDTFALRLPLMGAAYLPDAHRGYYRPQVNGKFQFAVRPPRQLNGKSRSLRIQDQPTPFDYGENGLLCFAAEGVPVTEIRWEILGE